MSPIYWNPDPVALDLGFAQLHWYGILFALSFLLGTWLITDCFKRDQKSPQLLDPLLFTMVIAVVLGARLGHALFYDFAYYSYDPWALLRIWEGGLASHGAGIGMVVGLWWFAKKHPQTSFWFLFDRIAITVALGASLIRLGNLMNSEIVGKPTNSDWGFVFERLDSIPRHPTPIYESLFYFLLFVLLWGLYRFTKIGTQPGRLGGIFLTATFLFRILIEFVKENQVAFEEGLFLNMGQILSLPFVVFGLYLLVRGTSEVSSTK